MQKNIYFILLSFSLVSCYTYQVKKQPDPSTDPGQQQRKGNAPVADNAPMQIKNQGAGSKDMNLPQAPVNVQERIAPNKNYRINVDGRNYKIIADKWESDSLVAHAAGNPKKILKFHKNQINTEKIAEKRFSQPIADIITVTVYAGIGVAIWMLVK